MSAVTEAVKKRPGSIGPPPSRPPRPSSSTLAKSTDALLGIDRKISLTVSDAGSELLRASSVQMNILQAMVTIALLDQDAVFPIRVEYVGPGTEDVTVAVYSQAKNTMTNRKVLWALSLIGNSMAMDPEVDYRSRTFLIGWEKKKIGMIQLFGEEEAPLTAGKEDAVLSMSASKNALAFVDNAYANNPLRRPQVSQASDTKDGEDRRIIGQMEDSIGNLVVTNTYSAAISLSLREIMIPFQKAVVDIAARMDNIDQRFGERVTLFDVDVRTYIDYRDYPDGPAPFWSYHDALLALLLSARMVVRSGLFRDLTFLVKKNNEEAGIGMIWRDLKKHPRPETSS